MPKYHGLSREEERKTVTKEKKRKRRNRGNSYRGEATTGTFTFPSVVPFFSFFFFFSLPIDVYANFDGGQRVASYGAGHPATTRSRRRRSFMAVDEGGMRDYRQIRR